ncbi:hypothetical protein [Paenibacillus medicaginis]|uniref:Bacteriophage SP-beta YorD domain-containing protein n=1 Tax=Paenibacillus medicaginis TaxID=1470560 RepID=A0ABV5C478_9BACL
MKAVPKVDKNGLFIEDVIMDDSFTGVVPFYADQLVTAELQPETDAEETDEQPEEEPQPAGYIVGVPLPAGLYKPRFDLAAWESYQEAVSSALDEYQAAYDEWATLPEEERGEAPEYVPPEQPALWVEGLTQEEIDELTKPPIEEPNETDLIGQQLTQMKLQAMQQTAIVDSLGQELTAAKINNMQLQQMISSLGSELAATKLEIISLKGADQV